MDRQPKNLLRVLFVEDEEDDALIEADYLEKAGYKVDHVRVENAEALQSALQDTWDLVISDCNLPSFNGREALRIMQESGLDIPFIVVSGVIGEVAAVDLMKAGAHDYVLKDNLARLIPVVERELTEARMRKDHRVSQAALQQSELHLRTLLDTAADPIISIGQSGLIESVNEATIRTFGYTAQELMGQNIKILMPEPYSSRHDAYLQAYAETGISHIIGLGREVEARRKDGSVFPIDLSISVMELHGLIQYTGIIRDITARKEAVKALRKERDFNSAIVDNAGALVVVLDREGRIVRFNPACERLSGFTLAEVEGKYPWDTVLPPEDSEKIRKHAFEARIADLRAAPSHYVNHWLAKNGQRHLIEWSNTLLLDDQGDTEFMVSIGIDITERQRAQDKLRDTALQLAEAQAVGHMGNWNWDIRAGTLSWSDEIYRIFGLHPRAFDATYEAFIERIHPEDREAVQAAVNGALNEMQPYAIDHRIVLENDAVRFVHEQGVVHFNDLGEPLRMVGTVQDITERKLSELVLRKNETRFRATFEQAAVGVAHVAADGRWLRVNDRLCEILGHERDELIKANSYQDIFHPDDLQSHQELVQELVNGECGHFTLEKRYSRKDGSATWIQLTQSLVRNPKNEPDYFILVIEDINQRKAAEARILATLAEKDTVLRELHHRVKNNMQVISSLLSLQARYAADKDPQQALLESRQRIRAMALIHEHLYDSSDLSLVDLKDYLCYLGERVARLHHQAGRTLKIQVSGETIQLPVDQALPCALICNELLTNAARHAYPVEQHERLIEIHIADVASGRPSIAVRDQGLGIDQHRITNQPATLGLVIVNALTRQLGGKIHFESANGTVATLRFPVGPSPHHHGLTQEQP